MELSKVYYDPNEYLKTESGSKVSRKSFLCGPKQIVLERQCIINAGAIIRGDISTVKIGEKVLIGKSVVLKPPMKRHLKGVISFPLEIGSCVFIDEGTIVKAAKIGSYIHIGKDCVINSACILHDCSAIADNSVLPADTVVPSFCLYGGNPAKFVRYLPSCIQDVMTDFSTSYYTNFIPTPVSST